jgi:alkylation response protein AidB-like acyl-CoA dehydrogenase
MLASGYSIGFMEEYPVSRYYKGIKILQIVEGTSEVQRMLIGRIIARAAGM